MTTTPDTYTDHPPAPDTYDPPPFNLRADGPSPSPAPDPWPPGPTICPDAPDTRPDAPGASDAREDAAMSDTLTGDQRAATGVARVATGVSTAGATPAVDMSTPGGHPATPPTSGDAPPMGHLGGEGVAGVATTPLSTDPAMATPGVATPATVQGRKPRRRMPRGAALVLAAVAAAGMILVAAIGFVSSYDTLRTAAVREGFGPELSKWIPIGVDGAILAFIAFDLVLTYIRKPWPVLRYAAHGMTLATVILNATAGTQSITDDPKHAFWHALMPVLFIVGVMAARRLVVQLAQLEDGTTRDRIPLDRWLFDPWPTLKMHRRMRLANVASYDEMIQREMDLEGYEIWLKHTKGGDLSRASEMEKLPMTMAGRGFTVSEALALPEKWEAQEAELTREKTERQRIEQRRQAEQEKADRIRALRDQGELASLEHEVAAETSAAQARADQARTEAQTAADTARIRSEHTRRQAERVAEAETQALESQEAAAARRKAAEDDAEAAEALRRAEAERKAAEAEKLQADRIEADRKAAAATAAAAERKTKEDLAAAAQAEREAQENRWAAAQAEAAALEAEDVIRLTPRERRARRVARMILAADGSVEAVPLAQIEAELGVSRTTAGELRQEAVELLEAGYPTQV